MAVSYDREVGTALRWVGMKKDSTMSKYIKIVAVVIWMVALFSHSAAFATPYLSFDCSAPIDQYAFDTQDANSPVTIKGTITAVRMKHDEYLPSASVRIASPDDVSSVGFQLTAQSDDADQFDLALITKQGENIAEIEQGRISTKVPVPFALYFSRDGESVFEIGGLTLRRSIQPMKNFKVITTCTSGQFRFLAQTAIAG